MRKKARFTEGDVKRAMLGARKAGIEIAAVSIEEDGSILIVPGRLPPVQPPAPVTNDWD